MLGLGKIKFMPGTFGSLATTIILFYLFHTLNISPNIILIGLIIIFTYSFYAVSNHIKNSKNKGKPKFKIETPNKGEVKIIAGTSPINVLIKAVKIRATIISLSFKGAINKLVKFLLHISSKNNILKLMLDLKRMS